MTILTVNTGSSSVRLGLFEQTPNGLTNVDERHIKSSDDVPEFLLKRFLDDRLHRINAAAHRIVHGGTSLTESCIIDEKIESEIERLSLLAPLHNPVALTWVRACRTIIGTHIPQIAVFDTSFFTAMPVVSKTYALPKDLCREHDIKRYGFHGIAHRAMLQQCKTLLPEKGNKGKVISVQLGSGCSITAIKDGRPVDTSMGFSPNEGLLMSTRSGDIDSGVLVYLQNRAGLSINELDEILNTSSGLLGVSGMSGNMKALLQSHDADAVLAVELYCYRVKKYIGAYAAALGGIDAVLIGGGVGEHSPPIRKKLLDNMEWCGILLDRDANEETIGKEGRISSDQGRVDVMVIPVDESAVMAEEAMNLL